VMNLLFAFVLIVIAAAFRTAFAGLATFAMLAAQMSVYLAVFNLLPVPPLDGSKLLIALRVPYFIYMELARFGFVLLILAFYYTGLGTWISYTSLSITSAMFQLTHALI
jgi:Zn-dependent protease